MNKKETIILLLCILLAAIPLYLKVYFKPKMLSFNFKFGAARTDTGTLEDTEEIIPQEPEEPEEDASAETASTGIYNKLDMFVVNIAYTEAQRFLKTVITLELSDKKVVKELAKKKTVVRDTVISVLSSKDFPEIDDINGKEKLRRELINALNAKLESGAVINLYFEEFVAQ